MITFVSSSSILCSFSLSLSHAASDCALLRDGIMSKIYGAELSFVLPMVTSLSPCAVAAVASLCARRTARCTQGCVPFPPPTLLTPDLVHDGAIHIHLPGLADHHGGRWRRLASTGFKMAETLRHHALATLQKGHQDLLETRNFLR